jgi:hypothetical protein
MKPKERYGPQTDCAPPFLLSPHIPQAQQSPIKGIANSDNIMVWHTLWLMQWCSHIWHYYWTMSVFLVEKHLRTITLHNISINHITMSGQTTPPQQNEPCRYLPAPFKRVSPAPNNYGRGGLRRSGHQSPQWPQYLISNLNPPNLLGPPLVQKQHRYSALAAINHNNNQLLESTIKKQRGQTSAEMVLRVLGDDNQWGNRGARQHDGNNWMCQHNNQPKQWRWWWYDDEVMQNPWQWQWSDA